MADTEKSVSDYENLLMMLPDQQRISGILAAGGIDELCRKCDDFFVRIYETYQPYRDHSFGLQEYVNLLSKDAEILESAGDMLKQSDSEESVAAYSKGVEILLYSGEGAIRCKELIAELKKKAACVLKNSTDSD